MTGLLTLLAAVVATAIVCGLLRWKNGRFSGSGAVGAADDVERVAPADLGAPLGERATLVQFSSAFCAPCRATRTILADVESTVDGVAWVELDVADHMDLAEQHHIMRTPTVLVLDPAGRVVTRASGQPRKEQVLAAIAAF